eukprot:gene10451-21804_t
MEKIQLPNDWGWIELWTTICVILCWSPLAMNLKVIYPEPLTITHDAYTSLVASISVATPLLIDLLFDLISARYMSFFKTRPATTPRTMLILSLFLPDLLMLSIAMPLKNVGIIICLFKVRNVLILYGIFGHLWRMDTFFRSPLVRFLHFFFSFGPVVGVFTGFNLPFTGVDISDLKYAYSAVACIALQSRIIQNEIQIKE